MFSVSMMWMAGNIYICFRQVSLCMFQYLHTVGGNLYSLVFPQHACLCVCFSINPSKSCGPYRLYSENDYVSWVAVTDVIAGWPEWASKVFFFFGTTAFFVPCFIVLW